MKPNSSAPLRVCMLVHNSLESDARVEREAASLGAAGYDVTVVAIWEPSRTRRDEERVGFRIRRVSRRGLGVDAIARWRTRVGGAARENTRSAGPAIGGGIIVKAYPRLFRVGTLILMRVLGRLTRILPASTQRRAIQLRMTAAALRTDPDIIHAHDLNTLAAGVRAARIAHAKLIYDSHEIAPGLPTVRFPDRVVREESRLIRHADAVIHTTPMRAEWAAETYRIPLPVVVRNIPEVPGILKPVDLADAAGFPPGTKVILHQGNMQPHRGLEALIEAMGFTDDGFGLLFLGGGRLKSELEAVVAKRDLADRVRFAPPVAHTALLDWTAGAWCGVSLLVDVSLNHRYSLPNKLFEYLVVGVPLVVSDNPEIARFVRECGAGEVCDPSDPRAIAQAIKRLEAGRDEFTAAARAVSRTLSWETERAILLDLYQRLGA